MRKDFLSFLKAISVFSVLVAVIMYVLSCSLAENKVDCITWFTLFYFIGITSVFHFGLLKVSQGKPQAFVRYYMGATTLKLFIHVIVLLMYCLFHRIEAVRFIITFLIFYLLYTAFEAVLATKKFRK